MRRAAGGLTLIELMVALAILAVLGALTVPAMGKRLAQSRLVSAAEQMAADITEARYESVRQGRALHVVVQPGAPWCWSVATDPGCPCGARQACELRHASEAQHPGVQLSEGRTMNLNPQGSAVMPTSAVLQGADGQRVRVELLALGRPRVCSEAGSLPRLPAC